MDRQVIDAPTIPQAPGEKLKWRHLTPEQRRAVSNGCGGKGSWVPVPDFLFTASCNIHDFHYWRGGDEADRLKADFEFYQAMLVDAADASWWRRGWDRGLAWLYYRAVRAWAQDYFHYGSRRTRADLPGGWVFTVDP